MSLAQGTYWYGIFQGTGKPELYCPPFYLGEREKNTFGDMAYIASTTFYYQGYAYPAYIALYSSTEQLTEILKDNLTLKEAFPTSSMIENPSSLPLTVPVQVSTIWIMQ